MVNNGGFGLRCEVGAYVVGRVFRLDGNAGIKDAQKVCVDSSTP